MSTLPFHETASDIMSARPVTVTPETPVTDAVRLLRESHARRLTVVSGGGEVLGVLELEALATAPADALVADVMSHTSVTVPAHAPSYEAVRLMLDRRMDYLPVVNSGRLAGVITRADVIHVFNDG